MGADPFIVEGVNVPNRHEVGGIGWSQMGKGLAWCAVVQIILTLLRMVLRSLWTRYSTEDHLKFVHKYVGIEDQPPQNAYLDVTFRWLQFGMSITTVLLWVYKTYAWHVSTTVNILELIMCGFFVFGYFLEMLRYEFASGQTFSANSLLDVITVVPLVLQSGLGCGDVCPNATWITVSYLRVIRVYLLWGEIESSGALENVEEFTRALILSVVKFLAILILFAGTMYIFEIMGDISGFQDQWVETDMGFISFFSMVYYVLVTISTVGYGDYTPVTVLGRLFVIVVILGGVLFFSMETGKIMTIIKLAASGKGRFTPKNPKRKHVLVIGGGVTNGPISVLESFLKSLLDVSHGDLAPEVVLMGNKEPGDDINGLLSQRWATRANVKYLWGNPTTMKDLKRARIDNVELCFVLADLQARAHEEDLQNIVRAAAVYKSSRTPMLVMLMDSNHVSIAVQTGLPASMCGALDSLEIAALASSAHCLGLSTLIINLALPDLIAPEEYGASDLWLEEYIDGGNKELYGMQLSLQYSGMDFSRAARDIYVSTGVMLIACQDENGEVVMNPGRSFIIKDWTVFFCIAEDENALASIQRVEGRDWLRAYEANRAKVAKKRDADRALLAARLPRPAFLALGALKEEPEEPTADEKARWEKDPGPKRVQTLRAKPKSSTPAALPGLKAGHFATMAKQQEKEKEKRMQTDLKVPVAEDTHAHLFETDTHVEDPDLLHDIIMLGDHIVVVGLSANLFPQFVSVIRQLRNEHLPRPILQIPIVVLYDAQVPVKVEKFLLQYDLLVYVKGDPLKLRSLITAGVDRCSKIIVVAGAPRSGVAVEPIMMDQDAILLLSMLESQINLWGRAPDVICELQVPTNIFQLAERFTVDKALKHGTPRRVGSPQPGSALSLGAESVGVEEEELEEEEPSFSSRGSRTHVRYSSGQVIHRAEFSSLFAAAYYTPGVLDLLRSMCQPPSSPTTSIVWKLAATASMIGQTFSKVYCAMVDIDAIPIGIYRRPNIQKGNALPVVYTCPQADAVIQAGDCVYVISTPEWCESHPEFTDGFCISPQQRAKDIPGRRLSTRSNSNSPAHRITPSPGRGASPLVGPIRFLDGGDGSTASLADASSVDGKAGKEGGAKPTAMEAQAARSRETINAATKLADVEFSSRPPRHSAVEKSGSALESDKHTSERRATLNARDLTVRAMCPSGHRLKKVSTPEAGWGCDACFQENFPAGAHMHGCRPCRWVCCAKCFKSRAAAAAAGIAEGAGQYSRPEDLSSPRGPGGVSGGNVSGGAPSGSNADKKAPTEPESAAKRTESKGKESGFQSPWSIALAPDGLVVRNNVVRSSIEGEPASSEAPSASSKGDGGIAAGLFSSFTNLQSSLGMRPPSS